MEVKRVAPDSKAKAPGPVDTMISLAPVGALRAATSSSISA